MKIWYHTRDPPSQLSDREEKVYQCNSFLDIFYMTKVTVISKTGWRIWYPKEEGKYKYTVPKLQT